MCQETIRKVLDQQDEPMTTLELCDKTGHSPRQVSVQCNQMAKYGEICRKRLGLQTIWWIPREEAKQ